MSALHSRSGSGSPSYFDLLEAGSGAVGHGLKLRPRASHTDLVHLAGSPLGADERQLVEKAKPALGAAAAVGGRLAPLAGATRRSWRRTLSAGLALLLSLVLLTQHRQLYRHGQDAVAHLYYGLDPNLLGRSDARYPAPHCCSDEGCAAAPRRGARGGGSSGGGSSGGGAPEAGSGPLDATNGEQQQQQNSKQLSNQQQQTQQQQTQQPQQQQHQQPDQQPGQGQQQQRQQRVAVVTFLRDDSYLPLLQQLECTLRRSNPGLELGLMMVPGELSEGTLALAAALNITLLPVEPLQYRNTYEARYGRNWLKVRAPGLTQYDSLLLVDSDVAVVGPIRSLFSLPVEFAAVWDQSKWLNRYRTVVNHINGGVMLLRPCAAVEAHMVSLLDAHPKLRFVHGAAEQDFFGWYYRYTGATLPLQWNCQAEQCLDGSRTVGGAAPKIVHYTRHKPFHGRREGELGHEFLCPSDELHRRSIMAGQMLAPKADAAAAAVGGAAGSGPEGQAAPAWDAAAAGAQQAVLEQAQQQQQRVAASHQEQAAEERLGDDAVQEQAAADPQAEQQQQQLQQQQQQPGAAGNVEMAVEPLDPNQQQAAAQQQQALAMPGPDAADGQLLAARAALSQHGGKELPGIK